jgi:TorA maturation chaperone TorD
MASTDAWTSRDMAGAFAFAHSLFRKPTPGQHVWLLSLECRNLWGELAARVDGLPMPLDVPADCNDYAERYIATFDVGTPAPPVPLIESHYNKREPIPRILHENILFYRQFGLQLRDSSLESADHLRHQLEFVQHLLEFQSQLAMSGQTAESAQVIQALADYVRRHLLSWLPEAIICAEEAPLQFAKSALVLAKSLAQQIAASIEDGPRDTISVRMKEVQSCSE